jgi:hypothetical protein
LLVNAPDKATCMRCSSSAKDGLLCQVAAVIHSGDYHEAVQAARAAGLSPEHSKIGCPNLTKFNVIGAKASVPKEPVQLELNFSTFSRGPLPVQQSAPESRIQTLTPMDKGFLETKAANLYHQLNLEEKEAFRLLLLSYGLTIVDVKSDVFEFQYNQPISERALATLCQIDLPELQTRIDDIKPKLISKLVVPISYLEQRRSLEALQLFIDNGGKLDERMEKVYCECSGIFVYEGRVALLPLKSTSEEVAKRFDMDPADTDIMFRQAQRDIDNALGPERRMVDVETNQVLAFKLMQEYFKSKGVIPVTWWKIFCEFWGINIDYNGIGAIVNRPLSRDIIAQRVPVRNVPSYMNRLKQVHTIIGLER